jgi:hypothetical protein
MSKDVWLCANATKRSFSISKVNMSEGQNRQQWWESNHPAVLGAVATAFVVIALCKFSNWVDPVMKGITKLAPSALNVSAIAVGFLATSEAILLSLSRSRVVRQLQKEGHYSRLIRFFRQALSASFGFALMSALLTALRLELGGKLRYACVALWAFFGMMALISYLRSSALLSTVLRMSAADEVSTVDSGSGEVERQNDIEIIEG